MDRRLIKMVNEARWADGQTAKKRLEDITYNPMRSQEEFVIRMVRENSRTEYGLRNNFKNIHTLEDFRSYIPLTSYDDYADYIGRIAYGEKTILTTYLTKREADNNQSCIIPLDLTSASEKTDIRYCQALYALSHKDLSLAICEHYDDMVELFSPCCAPIVALRCTLSLRVSARPRVSSPLR